MKCERTAEKQEERRGDEEGTCPVIQPQQEWTCISHVNGLKNNKKKKHGESNSQHT